MGPVTGLGAETAELHAAKGEVAHEAGKHHEEGLTAHAVNIWTIHLPGGFSFPITNSMLVTWGVALLLIIFAQVANRQMRDVPSGAQNFWEWLVESLYGFLEGIIGHELVRKTFWFFATIFIFILFSNWLGLVPGFGTIGYGTKEGGEFIVTDPWFRGANADLNMTLGMALVFFACWIVWAIQSNGPVGFLLHLFAPPKGDMPALMKPLMVVVFMVVGCLEVVSILFRPVSLSFRLFGNVYAGENMLEAMSKLIPGFLGAVLVPIPFYFMELLVGIVQALVFMLLTAVFTLLICQHGDDEGKAHH